MDSVTSGEYSLKCNLLKCQKKLMTEAWITACDHIFCNDCGSVKLDHLPVLCPRCSYQLNSPYDVMKSDLHPPNHFKRMVLIGLSPNDCLSAAWSAISFWSKQIVDSCSNYELYAQSLQAQVSAVQNYQMANERLIKENSILKIQLQQSKKELEIERRSSYNMDESLAAGPPLGPRHHLSSLTFEGHADGIDEEEVKGAKPEDETRINFPAEFVRPTTMKSCNERGRQFMGNY